MPAHSLFQLSLAALFFCCANFRAAAADVQPVPDNVRERFNLSGFYSQYLDVHGMPVVGSKHVSPFAIKEAAWIVTQMAGHRPEIFATLGSNNVRLAVMAHNEYTTNIPEHHDLTPKEYWDKRARGLGATPARPAVSCAEENVLCYPNDPYAKENICIHEFAHAIHEMALRNLDASFDSRLRDAFRNARDQGLWNDTYAATNPNEYWAEGVQSWFDDNRENDGLHNHVNTRDELKKYDPALAKLCTAVFGDRPWRYLKPHLRNPEHRQHLDGYDRTKAPRFEWPEAAVP